jgi:hypothetical protein
MNHGRNIFGGYPGTLAKPASLASGFFPGFLGCGAKYFAGYYIGGARYGSERSEPLGPKFPGLG